MYHCCWAKLGVKLNVIVVYAALSGYCSVLPNLLLQKGPLADLKLIGEGAVV